MCRSSLKEKKTMISVLKVVIESENGLINYVVDLQIILDEEKF